jgi:hypothetical protein
MEFTPPTETDEGITRCPHGVKVQCIACIFFEKVKKRPNLFLQVIVSLTLICWVIVCVFVAMSAIKGADQTKATKPPSTLLPEGFWLEYNEADKTYRYCRPNYCSGLPQDTKKLAIELAWYVWKDEHKPTPVWKKVD